MYTHFKVKFNLSLKICACNKILCENTPLDFHCVEEKVFLIKIISMIFCLKLFLDNK